MTKARVVGECDERQFQSDDLKVRNETNELEYQLRLNDYDKQYEGNT